MPQSPAAFQQTVWNPILDPTTLARGASTSIIALLLDFKNGIYQQTRTRTNLLLWSQMFGNAAWDTFNATVSDNSATAPDGTNTASTINVTQTTDRNRQMFTVVPGTVYTYSVWLKRGTCTDHKVSVYDLTHAAEILPPTSIYSQLSSTAWTRYTYTFTAPTGCTSAYVYTSRDNGAIGTYFVWGAQLEAAPAASAYIPTTSAAVSVTESVTVNGAPNVNQLYGYTYSRSGAKEEVGTTYGPELVNGGWAIPAGGGFTNTITASGTNSFSTSNAANAASRVYTPITTVAGKTYQVVAPSSSLVNIASISVYARDGGTGTGAIINNDGATGTPFTFTATSSLSSILFVASQTNTNNSFTSNASVKEVIPASSFAANVPAIIPGTGYFARPAYTNIQTWSQDFTNAYWVKNNVTIATGQIAPDGSSTATNASNTVSVNSFLSGTTPTMSASTVYTRSVYAKAVSGTNIMVFEIADGVTSSSCNFNLSAGTCTQATFGTTTITAVGNGWYRCAITFTTAATGTPGATVTYIGAYGNTATATTITLWQAQLVQASDPGPIIVTTSASAAVGADGVNLRTPITADQDFLLIAVVNQSAAVTGNHLAAMDDGTSNNIFSIHARPSDSPFYIRSGGGAYANGPAYTPTAGRTVVLARRRAGKVTGAYKTGGSVTIQAEQAATTFPVSLTRFLVGVDSTGGSQPNAALEYVAIRPGTFSDADLTNILTAL